MAKSHFQSGSLVLCIGVWLVTVNCRLHWTPIKNLLLRFFLKADTICHDHSAGKNGRFATKQIQKTTTGIFIFKPCFELIQYPWLASLNGFAGKPIKGM